MKKRAKWILAVLAFAALTVFSSCGNLFSAYSDETSTTVSVSSEVRAALNDAGLQVESWHLLCYFASGDFVEQTSKSGVFSVDFPDSDVSAVFIKPVLFSPESLSADAVPEIGGLYPFSCTLSSSSITAGANLVADFYGGVAATAVKYIFTSTSASVSDSSAENIVRLLHSFNWSKFESHIKTSERAVSYPLLIDIERFLTAFFEGNTSMYWNVRSLETTETTIDVPEKLRASSTEAAGIVFLHFYPDYTLEIEVENGALPATITLSLPDGQWFFLVPESSKTLWFAIQVKGGKVLASYSSEDIAD